MKSIVLYIFLFTCIETINGQTTTTPSDSTLQQNKELEEVVVVGQNQRAEAGELVFTPTARQKQASQDGYELLRHLAIPQISVDYSADRVTTVTGGDVALFINGFRAEPYEVKTLKTTDVLRVDYLDFPSDPKFGGEQHVVNFITKIQKGGGYTRAYAATKLLNKSTADVNIFSRYVYKRMAYDLYVGYGYSNSHHNGFDTKEIFSLLDSEGAPYELTRVTATEYSRLRSWELPVTFRALYSTERFQALNRISFGFNETPADINSGTLSITPHSGNGNAFSNTSNTSSKYAIWEGTYGFQFSHGYSMNLIAWVQYAHNNNNRRYSTSIAEEHDILTNSKEDAYSYTIDATGRKMFGESHSLSAHLWFASINNDIDYSGTSHFSNDLHETLMQGNLAYDLRLPINLTAHAEAGMHWRRSKTDEMTHCQLSPYAQLQASYAPSRSHQLNMSARYGYYGYPESMKTSGVLQSSEYLYITGNPAIKPCSQLQLQLQYTWLPSNNFFGTVFATYSNTHDNPVAVYSRHDEGHAILRSYDNRGDYRFYLLGLSLTYKPISNLQLECNVAYQPSKTTHEYGRSIHPVYANAGATWYLGKFYVSARGYLGGRNMGNEFDDAIYKHPAAYRFSGGWGDGAWNVQLRADNIFSSSWKSATSNMLNPLYSVYTTLYDGSVHRAVSVSVSYTFDYGKKVQRGNEITAPENTGNSAILK